MIYWHKSEFTPPNSNGAAPVRLTGVYAKDDTYHVISLHLYDPLTDLGCTLWHKKFKYLGHEEVEPYQIAEKYAKHVQKATDKYSRVDRSLLSMVLSGTQT